MMPEGEGFKLIAVEDPGQKHVFKIKLQFWQVFTRDWLKFDVNSVLRILVNLLTFDTLESLNDHRQ